MIDADLPPATLSSLDLIPPPLVPAPDPTLDSILSIDPPPCPREEDGWITVETSKTYRESMFAKDGVVAVSVRYFSPLSLPFPSCCPCPLSVLTDASFVLSCLS